MSQGIGSDDDLAVELDRLGGAAGTSPDDDASSAGPGGAEGALTLTACADADPGTLHDCGPAPELTGITDWVNSDPLTLADLRGKVVLVDFWTYSCINCQRTLPYLSRWADDYADDGLVVVGVHSPEFAFERERRNVVDAAARLGVGYPVALDNDFETWRAYGQRFWPAKYLVDRDGTVRQVHYGEGAYAETEGAIRELLGLDAVGNTGPTEEAGHTSDRTPETYLGSDRVDRMLNGSPVPGRFASYDAGTPPLHAFALGGRWRVEPEYAEAGQDAEIVLRFRAAQVHLVLAGEGTVHVAVDGDEAATQDVTVSGTPMLHTLYDGDARTDTLRLSFSPGVQAYAFTFG